MPFGYIGQNQTKQKVKNSGVLSSFEISHLEKQGHAGGSLELIEAKTISGVASAIFTDIKEDKYDTHHLQILKFEPATDHTDLHLRFYENGVEESGSNYDYAYEYGHANSGFGESQSTTGTFLRASFNTGNASTECANTYMNFYNLGDSSKYSFQNAHGNVCNQNNEFLMWYGGGCMTQTSVVNQIKLYIGESSTFDCIAKLYGVKI